MVFVTQMVLARELGAAGYGLFASSMATVTMAAPLAGFGLSQFRLRVYGVEGWAADRWLRPTLWLSVVTTSLAMGIIFVVAFTIAPSSATRTILLILSPTVLALFAVNLAGNKIRLEDRHRAQALLSLLVPTGRLAVALTVLLAPTATVLLAAAGYGAVAVAITAGMAPSIYALMRGKLDLHGHGARDPEARPLPSPRIGELWSQAWVYGLASALYPIFFQIGTVLLKYLGSNAQAGMYGIAMAVMSAIYLIPTTIYQKYLLSKLHRWAAHNRAKFELVYRHGIIAMLALGIAVSACMVLLAPWLVPIAFGEEYRGVIAILMVLALCPPLRFMTTAVGSVLLSPSQMRLRVWATGSAALVTIVLNLLLIPGHHALGAAFAAVGGEVVLLLSTWLSARKHRGGFR